MTRDELATTALEAFKNCNNIAIQAGTGVGKSKIAIELLNSKIKESQNPFNVLFVVAEVAHKDNWEKEIKKWKLNKCSYEIQCYASLKKYKDTKWDCVVYDEAHHLGTSLRLDIFDNIKSENRIFLSATLGEKLFNELTFRCGNISNIKCNLQEAFDSNILPEPKIILVPLTLDNKTSNLTITEEWGNAKKRIKFKCLYKDRWKYLRMKKQYPNVSLEIQCTQKQLYEYLSDQFEYYKNTYFNTRNEAVKNKWLQYGSRRKRALGLFKTETVAKLLKTIKNKRYICFCSSIEQANYLGEENAIHSNKKDSFNTIQRFNNKEISKLFAVGMLQEGVNLTDIEVGVIVQLDGGERAFIQKFGKILPLCI